MRLLDWDSSTKTGAIGAMEWDEQARGPEAAPRLVAEWTLHVDAAHSDRLLWGIHQTLEAARWKLSDVGLFGVGVGPGSFTGLRIGICTARALATVQQTPLVGVSSLAALARPSALWAIQLDRKILVIAAQDACKNQIFALWGSARSVIDCVGYAEGDLAGVWKRGVEEKVLRPEELALALKKKYSENMEGWIVLGNARTLYPDLWKVLPSRKEIHAPIPGGATLVQGRALGLLVWEGFQAGMARTPLQVRPRYLRASDAELKLRAGLLPKGPTRG